MLFARLVFIGWRVQLNCICRRFLATTHTILSVVGNLKEKMDETTNFQHFEKMHEEQLPVPKHKLYNWTHFAGLYAAD